MQFLPAPALRRILHLQSELVYGSSDPVNRALLSSSRALTNPGSTTPRHGKEASATAAARSTISSGNTATDLLLGMTGRNKLLAAGDRLRDLIIPDALAQAVSVIGTGVTLATGGGSGGGTEKKKKSKKERDRDDARVEEARLELDELVAGVCPLCEGAVMGIDKPFVGEGEDLTDWEV